jgi:hypothetical protein
MVRAEESNRVSVPLIMCDLENTNARRPKPDFDYSSIEKSKYYNTELYQLSLPLL